MTLENFEALNFQFYKLHSVFGFLVFIVYVIFNDMAETATRTHTLRSGNQESYSLPVPLHLSDDSKFMSDLLDSDRTTKIGQVSDSESSISESDCEALVASPSHDSKNSKFKPYFDSDPTSSQSDNVTQHDFNVQILSESQLLARKLDEIEVKIVKRVLINQR